MGLATRFWTSQSRNYLQLHALFHFRLTSKFPPIYNVLNPKPPTNQNRRSIFPHFPEKIKLSKSEKMSTGIAKSNNIRRIVSIRQMLQRWRRKARVTASSRSAGDTPSDVPAGHVAVCVGSSCRRFVVRATYLNHPIFKKLLLQAEEEYGFANQGPLAIPCDESVFEEVLRIVSRSESGRFLNLPDFCRRCHVDSPSSLLRESRPLLFDFADKSVC